MTPPGTRGRASAPPASRRLRDLYAALRSHYGAQSWWPGESALEMALGAILVQHTSWAAARAALERLRGAGALSWERIAALPVADLEDLVRPAGTFRAKARTLQAFVGLVGEEAGGDLARLLDQRLVPLRERLLTLRGIGPETADAICLYAARQPTFVVDACARRILERLGWIPAGLPSAAVRSLFLNLLEPDVEMFAQYHALLVVHARHTCRPDPCCGACPLRDGCASGRDRRDGAGPPRPAPRPIDWNGARVG